MRGHFKYRCRMCNEEFHVQVSLPDIEIALNCVVLGYEKPNWLGISILPKKEELHNHKLDNSIGVGDLIGAVEAK